MKVLLESTSKLVEINGITCRVWEGTTERGIAVHAFVVRVGVDRDADAAEFERDLRETRAPSAEVGAIPTRMLIDE